MDIAYAKADIVYQPKYDTDYDDGVVNHLNDPDYYKNYFKENLRLCKPQNLTRFILTFGNTLDSAAVYFRKIAGVVY